MYAGATVPPPGYSLETEVAGIRRVADEAGFDTFHLVGYSAGGASSLAFSSSSRTSSGPRPHGARVGRTNGPDGGRSRGLRSLPGDPGHDDGRDHARLHPDAAGGRCRGASATAWTAAAVDALAIGRNRRLPESVRCLRARLQRPPEVQSARLLRPGRCRREGAADREALDLLTVYLEGRIAAGELRRHQVTVTARAILQAIVAGHLNWLPAPGFELGLVDVVLHGVLAK